MSARDSIEGHANQAAMLRDEWLTRLVELTKSVRRWAEERDWSTRQFAKKMKDSRLGAYEAPSLMMQKETTRVLLDPVARFAPGAEGVVDLYLMPAYDDIASLYFVDGQWRLHYIFAGTPTVATINSPESRALSKEALGRVLDEMTAHASESL
ncbi:MAG TPA: hypothetical protein VMV69_05365 [Pirellulales bacterium]|nr:hypothetical protein [Pirellulales bacterium]